jgi:hypothetical protein
MTLSKFSLRLLAFSALVAGILYVFFTRKGILDAAVWGALIFFVILTFSLYAMSLRALRMSVKNSMSIILGTLVFRLFASLAYLITYIMVSGSRKPSFIIAFLILYLLYTVFEIYHLVVNLRPDSKK